MKESERTSLASLYRLCIVEIKKLWTRSIVWNCWFPSQVVLWVQPINSRQTPQVVWWNQMNSISGICLGSINHEPPFLLNYNESGALLKNHMKTKRIKMNSSNVSMTRKWIYINRTKIFSLVIIFFCNDDTRFFRQTMGIYFLLQERWDCGENHVLLIRLFSR